MKHIFLGYFENLFIDQANNKGNTCLWHLKHPEEQKLLAHGFFILFTKEDLDPRVPVMLS